MAQINHAQKAVKGLTTMINNFNAEKRQIESELAVLRETTATTDTERHDLERQIVEKEMRLSKVDDRLADKTAKLEKAQVDLEELEQLTSDAEFRHNMMQRSLRESSRSKKSQISANLAQVGFEEMINAVPPLTLSADVGERRAAL